MDTTALLAKKEKQNFSKYDMSGTDPNRYASVSNKAEADTFIHGKKKSIIPGLRVNVSTTERLIMIAAGSYFLYRALKKDDNAKVAEGIAAGTMLFRGISGYCPAYDALERTELLKGDNVSIKVGMTVQKPVNDVYNAWRRLENLPLFMKHLANVNELSQYKSEWQAKIPGGLGTVSWDAEILMDEPDKLLSWHSLPGSTINNSGKVKFTKRDDATTDIEVTISYHAPLGKAGAAAAKLLTPVFERMLASDIEGFKEYIETSAV